MSRRHRAISVVVETELETVLETALELERAPAAAGLETEWRPRFSVATLGVSSPSLSEESLSIHVLQKKKTVSFGREISPYTSFPPGAEIYQSSHDVIRAVTSAVLASVVHRAAATLVFVGEEPHAWLLVP